MQGETKDKRTLQSTILPPSKALPSQSLQNASQHCLPCTSNLLTSVQPHTSATKQPPPNGPRPPHKPSRPQRVISLFAPFCRFLGPICAECSQRNSFESPAAGEAVSAFPQPPHTPAPRSELRKGRILLGLSTVDLLNTASSRQCPGPAARVEHRGTHFHYIHNRHPRIQSDSSLALTNPEPSAPKPIYLPIPSK